MAMEIILDLQKLEVPMQEASSEAAAVAALAAVVTARRRINRNYKTNSSGSRS